MNTNTPSPHERAFTLTELVVLVAMLAILGILVPLRAASRPGSDRAICLNNLREIATATIMFAGDNNDLLPNPGFGTTEKSWLYSANAPDLTGVGSPAAQIPYARASQLWPYHHSLAMLQCPADSTNTGYVRFVNRAIKISSYNMTGLSVVNDGSSTQKPFKISQFQPNSIFFCEPDDFGPFNFRDGALNPGNSNEGISQRHVDIPLGASDGSVDLMIFTTYQRMRSAQVANRWYCYPLTANGRP